MVDWQHGCTDQTHACRRPCRRPVNRSNREQQSEVFDMKFQVALFAFASSLLLATPVFADADTDVMGPCKADVDRLCEGIQPGGGKVVACLKEKKAEISIGCA